MKGEVFGTQFERQAMQRRYGMRSDSFHHSGLHDWQYKFTMLTDGDVRIDLTEVLPDGSKMTKRCFVIPQDMRYLKMLEKLLKLKPGKSVKVAGKPGERFDFY